MGVPANSSRMSSRMNLLRKFFGFPDDWRARISDRVAVGEVTLL